LCQTPTHHQRGIARRGEIESPKTVGFFGFREETGYMKQKRSDNGEKDYFMFSCHYTECMKGQKDLHGWRERGGVGDILFCRRMERSRLLTKELQKGEN